MFIGEERLLALAWDFLFQSILYVRFPAFKLNKTQEFCCEQLEVGLKDRNINCSTCLGNGAKAVF